MLDYLASISDDSAAFASTMRPDVLDTAVPTCPGWSMRDLAHHVGEVQRWARIAVVEARSPKRGEIDQTPADAELQPWLNSGSAALLEALAEVDPAAPTWHPFTVPQVAAVWPRRQAHEIAIHRWDAQAAAGIPHALDPAVSADFVREYFEVIAPRVVARDSRLPPPGVVSVELVDVGVQFGVRVTGSTIDVVDPVNNGEMISGSAEDVLLALWKRQVLPTPAVGPVSAEWLEFGGN